MNLPVIKRENRYRRSIVNFEGLNLTRAFSSGEMSDCKGITHSLFPSVTQRNKSEKVFECVSPSAVIYSGKECIASDGALYYDRKKVGELSEGKKQVVTLGSRIVVFPDKLCYDTEKETLTDLCDFCETGGVTVTFTSTTVSVPEEADETFYENETLNFGKESKIITYESAGIEKGELALKGFSLKNPGELTVGSIFFEKCEKNQYRITEKVTLSDEGFYVVDCSLVTVGNSMANFFSSFENGDMVEISGCVNHKENNISATIVSKTKTSLTFASSTFTQGLENTPISFRRKIPDFSCVCSYGNRIWGCEGNTIYASALGSVENFFAYNNVSTDSFSVETDSADDFTACIAYGSGCLFFKENSCYKLYGNRPSNFQLVKSFGSGILKNDAGSIVSAGGKIIYKGTDGVYVFYGGMPVCVSEKLGKLPLKNAVAGSDGKVYYLTADTDDKREEFVWDIEKNLWSKSGVYDTIGYSYYGGDMLRLKSNGIEMILDETDEECEWSITLCPFNESWHRTKDYSRIHICAELFEGACMYTEVKADDAPWKTVSSVYGDRKKYVDIPCPVKSCHELKLRISGKGKSVLESVVREFSVN